MKQKINVLRLGGCSGCYYLITDYCCQNNLFTSVFKNFEIKHDLLIDIKEIKPADITIIEGNLVQNRDLDKLQNIINNSGIIIGLGTCTLLGGVSCLDELSNVDYGKRFNKGHARSNMTEGIILKDLIKFDYAIKGCPVTSKDIEEFFNYIENGFETDEVQDNHNLCYECPRNFDLNNIYNENIADENSEFAFEEVSKIRHQHFYETEVTEEGKCFIEQGIACLGLVTDLGCDAKCIKANVPCQGCRGSEQELIDRGVKLVNSLSLLLPTSDLKVLFNSIEAGYLYNAPYRNI